MFVPSLALNSGHFSPLTNTPDFYTRFNTKPHDIMRLFSLQRKVDISASFAVSYMLLAHLLNSFSSHCKKRFLKLSNEHEPSHSSYYCLISLWFAKKSFAHKVVREIHFIFISVIFIHIYILLTFMLLKMIINWTELSDLLASHSQAYDFPSSFKY